MHGNHKVLDVGLGALECFIFILFHVFWPSLLITITKSRWATFVPDLTVVHIVATIYRFNKMHQKAVAVFGFLFFLNFGKPILYSQRGATTSTALSTTALILSRRLFVLHSTSRFSSQTLALSFSSRVISSPGTGMPRA